MRTEFGEELPFGFEPIGAGVTGQAKPMSALRNEISLRPNLIIRRIG
jgi:hypothetical protein